MVFPGTGIRFTSSVPLRLGGGSLDDPSAKLDSVAVCVLDHPARKDINDVLKIMFYLLLGGQSGIRCDRLMESPNQRSQIFC